MRSRTLVVVVVVWGAVVVTFQILRKGGLGTNQVLGLRSPSGLLDVILHSHFSLASDLSSRFPLSYSAVTHPPPVPPSKVMDRD